MAYKHKSIWYSKLEPSTEPPRIVRLLMRIGCTGREAVLLIVFISVIGFAFAGALFLKTSGLTIVKNNAYTASYSDAVAY